MQIHADFSQRAVVRPDDIDWTPSPLAGVERKMLDRIGAEVARATSIVRYAPGSHFSEHRHDQGEEFLVLEGVFSDATGDFGPGAYVRNPPGSAHAPWSRDGCTIFVKLRQFAKDDLSRVVIDTGRARWQPVGAPGTEVMPLHEHGREKVMLVRLAPGTRGPHHSHPEGEELLVLEGSLSDEYGHYPQGTWIRNPPGSSHAPFSDDGCVLYVKYGHLDERETGG